MRQEAAQLWTERLRSDKYKQCAEKLMRKYADEDDVRHCCLNVLHLVAQENGVAVHVDETDQVVYWNATEVEEYTIAAPVRQWAGMQSDSGLFRDDSLHERIRAISGNVDAYCSLANCNDWLGMSFMQIADLIDEHWEQM